MILGVCRQRGLRGLFQRPGAAPHGRFRMKGYCMTLARHLMLSFAVMIAAVCTVAGSGLLALRHEHESVAQLVNVDWRRLALAHDLLDHANARAVSARNIVLVASDADRQQELARVRQAHAGVQRALQDLRTQLSAGAPASPQELERVSALEQVERRYGPVALAIVETALAGRKAEAILRMDQECRPLLNELIEAANRYSRLKADDATRAVADGESRYARSLSSVAALLAGAVIAAVWLGRRLLHHLTGPLRQAVAVARAVASGDLTVQVDRGRRDELGELMKSLAEMTTQLSQLVQRVRAGSDNIHVGSREIADGSLDLSRRTEQQAAASMDQLSANVSHNAAFASQASSLAGTAAQVTQQGGAAVDQVVYTMAGITESARRIAEINAVIDGIAFQTSILALNAAVEAARAGEHGRGFAVVASEVRALASRSAAAAREIKSLVAASVSRAEDGSRAVGEAGSTMASLVRQVDEVARLVGQIGTATAEQAIGIEEVGRAVAAIDQGTSQNAALVEQSNAAAESLRHQAEQMSGAVGAFRLA